VTTRKEVRAIQVAIACAVVGVSTKFTVGFITGSMSMISSAVDSVGDLLVSIANMFVIRIAAREADEDHNYGHAKIEGLGAMFEGGFIFAAAAFIVYEAVHKILVGEVSHDSTLGIVVMLPILALTTGTVIYLRKVARETGSVVVNADAVHYMTDVWVNVGVLVALVLVKLTGKPVIDSVISIVIALSMFRASWQVVRAGFAIVMDESLDPVTVAKVREVLSANTAIDSFHDLKTRKGKEPLVDFHVVVAPETTAQRVHDIYVDLRDRIRGVVDPATTVLMHADPAEFTDPGLPSPESPR
jgi:cation diffusion facilitator family transporter